MKNTREIKALDRIIEILKSPKSWTKRMNARSINGNKVEYYNPKAVCWCIDGAILKALREQKLTNHKWQNSYRKIVHAICKVANLKHDIRHQDEHIGFNDAETTTFENITEALYKARAFLKGDPH